MRSKYSREVYAALHAAGMSNREIARRLDVDEASVRRGLREQGVSGIPKEPGQRFLVTVTPVD